jgi:hypothetical protein
MGKNRIKVINRKLEVGGINKVRSNFIDSRFVSLVTFLPFNVEYGADHVQFEKYEDLPVLILTDGRSIFFRFIEESEQVFLLKGKKYVVMGYPQPTATMFSLKSFKDIFGKNPQEDRLYPLKIKLPQIDPVKILADINAILRKYVGLFDARGRLDNELYNLIAYWIMLTYVYDVWSKASYLKVMGIHDSGKTTLSRIIELLSFCSERSMSKISDSYFYRTLHSVGGVQCLDEIKLSTDDKITFIDLLKAGHNKGSFVKLSDKNKPNQSEHFNVFSPKVVAGTDVQNIDPILSSRMIDITMRPASEGFDFAPEDLYEDAILETTRKIRDQLYCFRLLYGHEYLTRKRADKNATFWSKKGAIQRLRNRDYDIFAPILISSRLHGGRTMGKSLAKSIELQLDIKKREFFEDFDLPIIRVVAEAVMPVEQTWLSARDISNTIVSLYSTANDHIKRSMMLKKYDTEIIVRRLKGLGLHRNERTDLAEGRSYLFARTDIQKFAKKRQINIEFEDRDQHGDILELAEVMQDIQTDNSDYREMGIPIDVIRRKLEFDPSLHLLHLAQEKTPIVMRKKGGRWLLIKTM